MYKINRSQIYLAVLIALFIHLTVLKYVMIFGASPNLVLICVIFFGLFSGPSAGLESGAVAGLLCDIFALDFFGMNALVYAVTGLAAGALSAKVFKESKKTDFGIVFFLTAFAMSVHFALVSALSKSLILTSSEYFLSSVLPASLYTAVVAIPVFLRFISIYNFRELQGLL